MNQRVCPRRDNSGYGIVPRAVDRTLAPRIRNFLRAADGSIDVRNSDGDRSSGRRCGSRIQRGNDDEFGKEGPIIQIGIAQEAYRVWCLRAPTIPPEVGAGRGGWGTSVTCITASWKPVSAPINFSPLIYTPATPSISELGETGATPASCFSFYLPLSPFLVLSRNSRFRSKIYKDSGYIKIDTDRFDRN